MSSEKKISIIGDQNRNVREFEVVVNFKKAFFSSAYHRNLLKVVIRISLQSIYVKLR